MIEAIPPDRDKHAHIFHWTRYGYPGYFDMPVDFSWGSHSVVTIFYQLNSLFMNARTRQVVSTEAGIAVMLGTDMAGTVGRAIKRLEELNLVKLDYRKRGEFLIQEINEPGQKMTRNRTFDYGLLAQKAMDKYNPVTEWPDSIWAGTLKSIMSEDPANDYLTEQFPHLAYGLLLELQGTQERAGPV